MLLKMLPITRLQLRGRQGFTNMALATQKVSVQFSEGIDQKTDGKLVVPGKLLALVNGVFKKLGTISLRFGLDTLGNSILGGGSLSSASALGAFKDEKILFASNGLYSRVESLDKWKSRGNLHSYNFNNVPIVKNAYQQSQPSIATLNGITVFAYADTRGGVRGSIVDEETGAFLLSDAVITSTGSKPLVIASGIYLYVFYLEGSSLKYQRVPTANPTTFVDTATVKNDVDADNHYDIVNFNNNILVTYHKNTNNVIVLYMDSTGNVNPSGFPAEFAIAEEAKNCLTIVNYEDTKFFVAYHNTTNGLRVFCRNADFSVGFAPTTLENITTSNVINITGAKSATNTIKWFYEISATQTYNQYTRTNTSTTAGAIGTAADFVRSIGLATKAFNYGSNNDIYVNGIHESSLQATYFTFNGSGEVVGRYQALEAGSLHTFSKLPDVRAFDTGMYVSVVQKKTRVETQNNTTNYLKGINRVTFDFTNRNVFQSEVLGENLHIIGGQLNDYDGVNPVENNFSVYPENVTGEPQNFTITVTQQGSGGTPEINTIVCPPGDKITGGEYFNISSALDATLNYVWFRKDGVGTDPAPGGRTGLGPVLVLSTDTGFQVATKLAAILDASADYICPAPAANTNTIICTNAANGNSTDAANITVGNGVTGNIAAGTYGYKVIYHWEDQKGQIHRSATSINVSVTTTGANQVVIIFIPTLRITRKQNVTIQVYRTVTLGTVYYRLTSLSSPVLNSTSTDLVIFRDTSADSAITGNEIIYTQGGILDNYPCPPINYIANFNNRIWAITDEPNKLSYSKDYFTGEGVAFNPDLEKIVDPAGGDLVAIKAMDDKMIIFKRSLIRGFAGNGPDNAGNNENFTSDDLITTDVGCIEPRSVVLYDNGILFKSSKGIYSLSRSLALQYIGAPVEDYNSQNITSAVLVDSVNQVRFTTDEGVTLVYDYFFNQWDVFENYEAVDAINWGETYYYVKSNGLVRMESSSFTDDGAHIPLFISTAWFKFDVVSGFQRIYEIIFLGEYQSSHKVSVDIFYDYEEVVSQTVTWQPDGVINTSVYGSGATYGSDDPYGGTSDTVWQFRIKPRRQQCQAIRFDIRSLPGSTNGEGFSITDVSFLVGVQKTLHKAKATKSL